VLAGVRFRSGWGSDQGGSDFGHEVSESIAFSGHEVEGEGDLDSEGPLGRSYTREHVGNGGPHKEIISTIISG